MRMSSYDKPGSLDGAIDAAVREMMQLDPRPGLRQRVTRSVRTRPERSRGVRFAVAWAAAAAVVVIASALLLRSPEPVQSVDTARVAVATPAAPVAPPAGPQASEVAKGAEPKRARVRRAPTATASPESIFGSRTSRVSAASLRVSPEPELSVGPPEILLELPPTAGRTQISPIVMEPIRVAPLIVPPLSLGAFPPRK